MGSRVVVTGGGGFIGAHLVRRLVAEGWNVSVVDTMVRGDAGRLADVSNDIKLATLDVRDEEGLTKSFRGADLVIHLAAVNGTENFYNQPELVLDIGLRGALAVVNACRRADVPDLVMASSAEVYQSPPYVPTAENVPLMLPDAQNPRYSYGGSKIVTELIGFNYAREHFRKMQVFRPHNVYGPDMGWKHVIPQFIERAKSMCADGPGRNGKFQIQGDGTESRAFCYVDDAVDGILTMYQRGEHRHIYHIGNDEEVNIRELAVKVGALVGVDVDVQAGDPANGGTKRRCPDIGKLRQLGYSPKVNLDRGLRRTVEWYVTTDVKKGGRNDLM